MKIAALWMLALLFWGCARRSPHSLIVLGVDGMDPGFLERHWNDLPNLRSLRDRGGLTRLATTVPPQSPVAWATFITGTPPEQHGLFDFVHREPTTMQPVSSMAEIIPPSHTLTLGKWLLPLSSPRVQAMRRGRTFWETLSNAGIPVSVLRMPTNYPPVTGAGDALAGMGTPDLEGTFGTFTFYTDNPGAAPADVSGGRVVPVTSENNRVVLPVQGPANTLRPDHAPVSLNLVADIDPEAHAAQFRMGEEIFIIKEGEWSPWIHVRFPFLPMNVAGASGMFRIYAQQLTPGIQIYRSPLNIDPADPALPISAPPRFARETAGRAGAYYTQGIEEDTSALRQGVLNLNEYLAQSRLVGEEHTRLLGDALSRFHGGLLFFYFSEIDQDSHVLWGRRDDLLLETYRKVDRDIGTVLRREPAATVIVMSDHGFASFDYAVNLNTWLQREGFLGTIPGSVATIDWKQTRAYAMGLNALYINQAGREQYGQVMPGNAREELVIDLTRRLREQPWVADVTRVGRSASRFSPDLIVGYAPGFRASWETGLGAVPPEVVYKNNDPWIADHCITATGVPGVLLGTRAPKLRDPQLTDMTVAVLQEFGIQPEAAMHGRSVY